MVIRRISVIVLLAACATPRATFSSQDVMTFQRPPWVAVVDGQYSLRWQYGAYGFSYRPAWEMDGSRLVFWLPQMTNVGELQGQFGELALEDDTAMRVAIEAGEVYWLESDGELTKLQVLRDQEASPSSAVKP